LFGLSYKELQQISSKKMEGVKKRKWEDVDSNEDSNNSKDSSSSSDNISIHTQEEEGKERDNDFFGFDKYAALQDVYAEEHITILPF